jgi:adenylate cyclase
MQASTWISDIHSADRIPRNAINTFPLLDLSGHAHHAAECPLSGVKPSAGQMSAFDAKRTRRGHGNLVNWPHREPPGGDMRRRDTVRGQIGDAVVKNLTSWVAVGTIVALTGFGPEHWFVAAFRYVEIPQAGLVWPSWVDIRAVIVSIGVAIVVADVLVRRMRRERAVTEAAGTEAPLPQLDQVMPTLRSRSGDEGPAGDAVARATDAATFSVAPPFPDRPSIVVLPFANMSRDLEQEYFSDGISEDIITDLSKASGLFVIARNSAFVYKDKAVNVPQVCRDLGVRFALEGSIRKSGNRVRVTAQLIDGSTGGHLWAERYDRDLTDIFDVQDDVTQHIVGALKVTLSDAEKSRIAGGGTKNVEAHDLFLKGRELMFALKRDREIFDRWMACFRRASELDPNYSDACAGLSMGYFLDHQNRWSDKPELSLGEAERFADVAIAKDDKNPFAHFVASMAAMSKKDYRRWTDESEKALSLNPNYAPATVARGIVYIYTGEPAKAIPYIEQAMRLDPTVPAQYLHFLGTAYFVARDYEAAAKMFKDRIAANPHTDLSRAFLASTLGHLGRAEEARRIWQELEEINPRYSLENHIDRLPFKDLADAERIVEGVRKAGLPIWPPAPPERHPPSR